MATTLRPRVLIENRDEQTAAAQAAALERAGFEAILCAGPSQDGTTCPVLWGETCELVDQADLVVHDLDLREESHRDVLRGLQRSYPGLPIVVEATTHTARSATGDLDSCTVVVPYSMDHFVGAVADALAKA